MRIVVVQSGQFDHFLSAARAAGQRDGSAHVIALVKSQDLERARESGVFAAAEALPDDFAKAAALALWKSPIDLCVLPFEDRLGLRYFRLRRLLIGQGIKRIATYNRLGRLREYGRMAWVIHTLAVCLGIRAVHQPISWLWRQVRRRLDVAALFALAVLALPLSRLKAWGLYPAGRAQAGRSSGANRLVLFIPSMGMGGAQRQMLSFLTHLDRASWEPELVTLDVADKFFEQAVRDLHVPVVYLNPRQDFWMVEVVWRLFRHLRRQPPVVLHSWLHYAVMLGAVAGAWAGVPVVIGSLRSQRPGRFPWFYPKWQRGIDILTAPLQTTFIANSNAVAEENRDWAFIPPHKLITVYNGIELEPRSDSETRDRTLRDELGLPHGAPIVGIVGRLFPEKDHATFLRAAALIGRTHPAVRFLIVGDGVLRGQIEQEIAKSGLAGTVLVLGARQDAPALIRLMDVLVLTSLTEGFPNVLLEAIRAGTPIVTTAAGGASEVVADGKTGFVVPCGDAAGVATRVLDLLGDSALTSRFVQAGLARAGTLFSADQMAKSIQAGYLSGWDGAGGWNGNRGGNRQGRLHLCFIAPYVLGFLRPRAGLPMGGAEVQVGSLARELARDPRLRISLLTKDGDRTGLVQEGALTLALSPIFGGEAIVASVAVQGSLRSSSGLIEQGRQWLGRMPGAMAWPVRMAVRTVFACQRAVNCLTASPRLWLAERWQEGLHCLAWWKLLRSIDADVYVMRCASPQVAYVKALCALMNRRLVYMVAHEDDVSGAYAKSQGVRGRRFAWGLQRADAIVCQHGDQARLVQAHLRREGMVIRSLCPRPLGVGPEIDVVPWATSSRRTILWMARLVEWKQPELLLEVAKALPNESFVMVSPAEDAAARDKYLADFRQRLAQVPNLRWLTNVPFEDTQALFAQAKVFVNTSRAEGFPNTFLQAAAGGTPVVSWSVNPEGILDRYQFGICANGDHEKFVQAVSRLATDPVLASRLGENGRRYIEECHEQAAIIAQYTELFLSLSKDPLPVAGAVAAASPAA